MILIPKGYEVITTTDGQQALSFLQTQSVDLVTQDFMRPQMDGFELLKIMQSDEALSRVPVLAVTAGAHAMRAEQMQSFGLDIDRDLAGFVTKPFGPYELLDAVTEVLIKHRKPIPPQAAQLRGKYLGRQPSETDRARHE